MIPDPKTALRPARVLIVEDELEIAAIVSTYLAAFGYETSCAYDGLSAISALTAFNPDLVFLDLCLPKLDGPEVLRQIADTSTANVVLMTAQADEAARIAEMKLVKASLLKPFDPNDAVNIAIRIIGGPEISADV